MKTNLFLILMSTLFLGSCQKEVSLEKSTGSGGSGSGLVACKDCIYIPMCDGSWYTYNDTLLGTAQIATDTLRFVKDTTISSLAFKKFLSVAQQSNSYANCNNGISRVIAYNAVGAGGSSVTKIDITMLKANLAVNGAWTDTIVNPAGQQVLYTSTLEEKGVSRTVNGKVFADVMHVYVETGIDVPGFGFFLTNTSDYYYAKGVGLIEAIIEDPSSGTLLQHRAIKAYFIP